MYPWTRPVLAAGFGNVPLPSGNLPSSSTHFSDFPLRHPDSVTNADFTTHLEEELGDVVFVSSCRNGLSGKNGQARATWQEISARLHIYLFTSAERS